MNTLRLCFTAAALAALATLPLTANADAGLDLAKSKNCLACHNEDQKVIGPAYKDVAAKYKGDKQAENNLVNSVLKGSIGKWGQIPMPPNAISEADAHTLVKWVLSH